MKKKTGSPASNASPEPVVLLEEDNAPVGTGRMPAWHWIDQDEYSPPDLKGSRPIQEKF